MIQIHQTDLGTNIVLSEAPPKNTWLEAAQDMDVLICYPFIKHIYSIRSPYLTSLSQDEILCRLGVQFPENLHSHHHMLYLSLLLAAEAGEI